MAFTTASPCVPLPCSAAFPPSQAFVDCRSASNVLDHIVSAINVLRVISMRQSRLKAAVLPAAAVVVPAMTKTSAPLVFFPRSMRALPARQRSRRPKKTHETGCGSMRSPFWMMHVGLTLLNSGHAFAHLHPKHSAA